MDVREKIKLFPHSPGVYRYYDAGGNVIYVGKAKDLNKRVAQYFVAPERLNTKTRILVSKIADAQFSVVDSEADALLLENNLIKQYKPRYNILLKDSKTYPWICVSAGEFPQVFLTRHLTRNGSRYYGPYSSATYANSLLSFFRSTYPLRSCKLNITGEGVLRRKYRPCLEMHIGRCKGCCVGGVSREEYARYIDEIERLLKGGVRELIQGYEQAMKEAAAELRFEDAQHYKDRADALRKHYASSIISSVSEQDADVFSLVFDGNEAFGNFLRVRGGAIIQSLNLGFKMAIEEEQAAVLSEFIAEIQSKFGELSRELVVPFLPDVQLEGVHYRLPVRGQKLALLELSVKNAREFHFNALKVRERTDPDDYRQMVLEDLRKALGMKELPVHMECFDNSNIQGTNPVASCVVFRDGVPARMLEEAPDDLPQLVVIDGGKGQLDFAWQALAELGLTERLTVIGLAKRLEAVIRVGDPYPLFIDRNSHALKVLFIDRNSHALKVLQQIRDEAHRFGITFHRNLRSKAALGSALRDIKGVGEQTEQRLLMHFGSVARIAAAPVEDLAAIVPKALAERIHRTLTEDL